MIHAYDKSYLSNAQKNLAGMLDYLVNDLDNSLETAWKYFLTSEMAFRFENGDCSVIAGKSGVEIAYAVLEEAGKKFPSVMSRYSYNRSQEYWTGWVLAYYQWDTGLAFSDIENAIPIQEIRMLYEPYHEMDIRQLTDTKLKDLRKLAGLSQSELSAISGISVRTIQQYEQRQKNINRAQTETLLRLAKVLCCEIEELMEKV